MKLGLTGGIGCGKSTAMTHLQRMGWQTLQADALAKGLLDSEPEIKAAIIDKWPQALGEDGKINRSLVAEIVFNDASELRWLESLLHPIVRQHWLAWMQQHTDAPCVVEIPLLFEKDLQSEFDATLCIAASESNVASRMQARDSPRRKSAPAPSTNGLCKKRSRLPIL